MALVFKLSFQQLSQGIISSIQIGHTSTLVYICRYLGTINLYQLEPIADLFSCSREPDP